MILIPEPFSPGQINEFEDFYCGDKDYQVEIHEWIKNSGPQCVLDDMRDHPDMEVWAYRLETGVIVGFGSLDTTTWEIGEGSGISRSLVLLPVVGMDKKFHGMPDDPNQKKYSHSIMSHLILQARLRVTDYPFLGLFVHPENRGAKKLYSDFQFIDLETIKYSHPDFGIEYDAKIRDLRIPLTG